jgi:hypothetical protein
MVACSSCSGGKVRCPICNGGGRFRRWLEVVEKSRDDVQVEPDGDLTRPFAWGTDGTAATAKEIELDAKIVVEQIADGPLSMDALSGAGVPLEWVNTNWRNVQPKWRAEERVRRQTFWLIEVPSIEISYALGGSPEAEIAFEGRRMLAPPASAGEQFVTRAQRIRRVRQASLGLAILLPLAYVLRGSYFLSLAVAGVGAAAAFTMVAVDRFLREATLGHSRARTWAVLVGIGAVAASGFAFSAEPSLRSVRREIGAHHLRRARDELAAFGSSNEAGIRSAWADLHLASSQASADLGEVVREAQEIPIELPQRTAAGKHVYEIATREAMSRLASRHPAEARAALAPALALLQTTQDAGEYAHETDELLAQSEDQEFDACQSDPCRLAAALKAVHLSSSAARQTRADSVRDGLSEALSFQAKSGESTLVRLQRLRELAALARGVADAGIEGEIASKAGQAASFASAERAKVPLVGADNLVAAELLGSPMTNLAGRYASVSLFCQLRGNRCVGVYIVGIDKASRVLNVAQREGDATRALSLALGRATVLPEAPKGANTDRAPTVTRWTVGGVPIVGRWRDAALLELRVGEVKP